MSSIALQIERTLSGPITVGSNIIFDSTVFSTGNISYDNVTGVITFNEAGRYVMDWWVVTQTSLNTSGIVFALSTSQGDYLEGISPLKSGEAVGIAIVDVDAAPVTMSLVNAASNTVFLSTTAPLTAVLFVVGDDVVGVTGLTGSTVDADRMGDSVDMGTLGDNANESLAPGAGV